MSEPRPTGDPAASSRRAADTEAQPAAATAPMERPRRTDWNPIMRGAIITFLVLFGMLFLALFLNSTGMMRIPGLSAEAVPTREPLFGEEGGDSSVLGGAANSAYPGPGAVIPAPGAAPPPPPGAPPGATPAVGPRFEGFYYGRGGDRILGRPISAATAVNGREVQWFERGRVEHWPEYAGTPYELQLGLVGVEYTAGRTFPNQGYFVSGPDLRYFPETSHAVGGAFLRFYDQNGGLDVFGYPISEEFDEVLPDGRTYRVQYFQRARMEYHPENAGTPYEVQLGLLGTALYLNEDRPTTVVPAPTPVP